MPGIADEYKLLQVVGSMDADMDLSNYTLVSRLNCLNETHISTRTPNISILWFGDITYTTHPPRPADFGELIYSRVIWARSHTATHPGRIVCVSLLCFTPFIEVHNIYMKLVCIRMTFIYCNEDLFTMNPILRPDVDRDLFLRLLV